MNSKTVVYELVIASKGFNVVSFIRNGTKVTSERKEVVGRVSKNRVSKGNRCLEWSKLRASTVHSENNAIFF